MKEDIEIDLNDMSLKPIRKNIHERNNQEVVSAKEMDENRRYEKEYEYLCYMAQARDWISELIDCKIKTNSEFKEKLRKGEILAQLASVISNHKVKVYENPQLVYRHTDNHNVFLNFCRSIDMHPCYFYVVLDAYNEINTPSVIFCLHALSNHLGKLGYNRRIEKKDYIFTEKELCSAQKDIENFTQFDFTKIGNTIDEKDSGTFFTSEEQVSKVLNDLIKMKLNRSNDEVTEEERILKMVGSIPDNMKNFLNLKIKEKVNQKYNSEHSNVLKRYIRAFLQRNAMKEIFLGKASLFSIKQVLKRQSIESLYLIECMHEKIINKIKENTDIEEEIDDILTSIELILDSKRLHSGLSSVPMPIENNKKFEKIFNLIRSDPKILLETLSKIDQHELEDFIPRYIIPLFSNSSTRDQFLILQLIDEDFSSFTNDLYSEENDSSVIHNLSFRVIIDLFRSSDVAKKICSELLITDRIRFSTVKEEYTKSLTQIKEIVKRTIEKLRHVEFPTYVAYFFAGRNKKSDLEFFYEEFISPFIAAPDAFYKKPNFKFDRNALLAIDAVFMGAIKGQFSSDYYKPLSAWAQEAKVQLEMIFEEMMQKTTSTISFGLFRAHKPSIKFQYKELNDFLNKIKIFTTQSREYNELVNSTHLYSYIDNDCIKLNLNPIIRKNTYSEIDNLIDIIRVSDGKDLFNILKRKSTEKEEMKYKKLVNFKNLIRKRLNTEDDTRGDSDEKSIDEMSINDECDSSNERTFADVESIISDNGFNIYNQKRLLDDLKENIQIKEISREIIGKICERIEEIQILICQKKMEMKINNKTLLNLKKQNNYLKIRKQAVIDYNNSLLESYFKKTDGNCSKKSIYGTYRYTLNKLLRKEILTYFSMESLDKDQIKFYFGCDQPGLINICIYHKNQLLETHTISYSEMLKSKDERGIQIGGALFNPKGLLRIVNDCYFE